MHIHTCLSPCADVIQSPLRVVEQAFMKNLNLIFITDHNTIENVKAAMITGKKYQGLNVLPGMEITSKEEVHTLALFSSFNDAINFQLYTNNYLPDTDIEKEFQEQILANEFDEVLGFHKKSLSSAVNLRVEEIVELIHKQNGLAVAAHIDRQSFSVLSQLGFIPAELKFDALEVSPNITINKAKQLYPEYYDKFKFITGSDAHSLHLIGSNFTEYESENNSFDGLKNFLVN
jgi:3',5'-nucleoside bisphosphate phosphatase